MVIRCQARWPYVSMYMYVYEYMFMYVYCVTHFILIHKIIVNLVSCRYLNNNYYFTCIFLVFFRVINLQRLLFFIDQQEYIYEIHI